MQKEIFFKWKRCNAGESSYEVRQSSTYDLVVMSNEYVDLPFLDPGYHELFDILEYKFLLLLKKIETYQVEEVLDYHYNYYKSTKPNNSRKFFKYLKYLIETVKEGELYENLQYRKKVFDSTIGHTVKFEDYLYLANLDEVLEWLKINEENLVKVVDIINQKNQGIKCDNTELDDEPKEYTLKVPVVIETNKPKDLTANSLMLLFRLLRDHKFFNGSTDDKEIYLSYQVLTGYSYKQFRKIIGTQNIEEEISNTNDYEKLIIKLKRVIKELEEKKGNLR